MNLVKKYIHDCRSMCPLTFIGRGKSSIPEVKEAPFWLMLSCHLKMKISPSF